MPHVLAANGRHRPGSSADKRVRSGHRVGVEAPRRPGECIQRGGSSASRLVREHYDRYGFWFAESDAARRVFGRRSQLGRLLRDTHVPDGPIVDVGCGEGRVHLLLDGGQAKRYVGLDLSTGILARARRRLGDTRFLRADACGLPLRDDSVALAVCQGVLHHTAQPRAAFTELARVTKPGGLVQLSVYNRRALYYHLFRLLGPLCFACSHRPLGRAVLAVTVFPLVYVLVFEPAHLVYGVHMPLRGGWRFFLDQFAHPRVWFFRRREVAHWAAEEGLEIVRFDGELAGWMLSFVLRRGTER